MGPGLLDHELPTMNYELRGVKKGLTKGKGLSTLAVKISLRIQLLLSVRSETSLYGDIVA